ncbi:hypothetical protein KOW79_015624 [Hemibagrus wyckioides]|uniref:Uncharacterized protein n=1 Tax=Hemibagrus wyckioides TaxID=337641 RepID=A0A9D3NGH3_9TELE|nr:hypothetical protein KOW79_015624 [Hemibagrus wyckioides]
MARIQSRVKITLFQQGFCWFFIQDQGLGGSCGRMGWRRMECDESELRAGGIYSALRTETRSEPPPPPDRRRFQGSRAPCLVKDKASTLYLLKDRPNPADRLEHLWREELDGSGKNWCLWLWLRV